MNIDMEGKQAKLELVGYNSEEILQTIAYKIYQTDTIIDAGENPTNRTYNVLGNQLTYYSYKSIKPSGDTLETMDSLFCLALTCKTIRIPY